MTNNFSQAEPKPASPQPKSTEATSPVQKNSTGAGQLVVNVFTANQVLPVNGAQITVTAPSFVSMTSDTDRSGRSVVFDLPAPDAAISQDPSGTIPFADYTVEISHPQYFKVIVENVQIFDGILTQLPVNLVPLPEIPQNNSTNIILIPKQNL